MKRSQSVAQQSALPSLLPEKSISHKRRRRQAALWEAGCNLESLVLVWKSVSLSPSHKSPTE